MTSETGPFLKAAIICSDVIEGKDGVLSLIRVIDRLTIAVAGQQIPAAMPTVPQLMKLVLMFVSGRAEGTHNVAVKIERPNAEMRDLWTGSVFLEGEDRGANLVIGMQIAFELEGLYWFDVYFDGGRITRIPFRVIYQRALGGTA
jgi:hypothetical protein